MYIGTYRLTVECADAWLCGFTRGALGVQLCMRKCACVHAWRALLRCACMQVMYTACRPQMTDGVQSTHPRQVCPWRRATLFTPFHTHTHTFRETGPAGLHHSPSPPRPQTLAQKYLSISVYI